MTKYMEALMVEDEPREPVRHRRVQQRNDRQLSGFFSGDGCNSKEKESKPRFQIDAIVPAVEQDPPRSHMRVLLCNAKTMKYLGSRERWTKDAKEARDFRNGWWATVYAFTMNPRHLVIHCEFDDDRYNLHIPVLGHAPA